MEDEGLLENTKVILKSLIVSAPTDLSIEQLNKDYRTFEGCYIPYGRLGYAGLEQFLKSIPDTLQVYKKNNVMKVVAVSVKATHINKMVAHQKNSTKTKKPTSRAAQVTRNFNEPTNNTFRMHNPVSHSPQPLFPPHQRDYYHMDQSYMNNNMPLPLINNTDENKTANEIDNKFNENLPTENNNTNQTDLNKTTTTTTTDGTDSTFTDPSAALSDFNSHSKYSTKCASMDEAIPEIDEDDPIFLIDMSDEIVKYGKKIDISKIPDGIEVGSIFGIFVTEVNSPYKFWFHIQECASDLDLLMQEMTCFYTKLKPHKLQIRNSDIVRGQVCVALFLNLWHRAEIIEYQISKAKVFFIDYGTIADIKVEDIKYLVHEYSLLRCQAHRGCLDYIKPLSHKWARDATIAFLALMNDLLLYAQVTDINRKDRIVHMLLTDTDKAENIIINDALIKKGYARLNFEITDISALVEEKKKRHFSEKYPTFEQLESGSYPSFCDIGALLAKGYDYEELLYENMIRAVDMDIILKNI